MQDPTRMAALDLLEAVLGQRRSLEDALDRLPKLEPRDRAAAHRLTAAVLRRLGTLDAVLDALLRKSPPETVRHILRLGSAALLLLGTPAHAAVGTAVALARAKGLTPFAGLVNAVLRRVAAGGASVLEELDGPRLDTPPWLWASWGAEARAIAVAHQQPAPVDITPRAAPPSPAVQGGIVLPTGSVRFPAGTRIAELPGFAEGDFWVQDAAAALPARLLGVRPGERVADLCAAPGGKTAQLAASGAQVIAVERDDARIARLRENMKRLRLHPTIVQADATEWRPSEKLDAVLLDAPCSATGTIRRHPDLSRTRRPQDVAAMTEVQDRLLAAVGPMLKPGGRLVYAVCSLQPEEGEPRIRKLIERGGWRLEPFAPSELPGLPEAITADGFLRTHPGMWAQRGGIDGFFAARLLRN